MMDKIWLSIIIPVYNTEKYIKECLESIIRQYIEGVEVICVDDGSSDNSGCIIKEYAKNYPYIKYFMEENKGVSSARNLGLENAKGDYITFLDSDDSYSDNALLFFKDKIENIKMDVLCYDAKCIYESDEMKIRNNKSVYYERDISFNKLLDGEEMFCQFVENDKLAIAVWNMCIKSNIIKDNNIIFEPEIIYEDFLFLFDVLMKAKSVIHINDKIINYNVRSGSLTTSKITALSVKSYVHNVTKLIEFLIKNQVSKRLEQAIINIGWQMVGTAKRDDAKMDEETRRELDLLSGLEGLIAAIMNIGNFGNREFSSSLYETGFIEVIRKSKKIILYGAGEIGVLTYQYIKKLGMEEKIIAFVVSRNQEIKENIKEKIPVMHIDELDEKDSLLMICASKMYALQMYKEAQKLRFEKIEIIDCYLENIIRKKNEVA